MNFDSIELPFYCVDINEFKYYRFDDLNHILKFDLRSVNKYVCPFVCENKEAIKTFIRKFSERKNIKKLTFEEFEKCFQYAIDFIINYKADPRPFLTEEEIQTNKEMLSKDESFYEISFDDEF